MSFYDPNYKALFDTLDISNSGEILVTDLKQCLLQAMKSHNLERIGSFHPILIELEKHTKDTVNYSEFTGFFRSIYTDLASDSSLSIDKVQVLWDLFDTEMRGLIGFKELSTAAQNLDLRLTSDEISDLISQVSTHPSGEIAFDDFKRVMQMKISNN